LTVPSSKGRNQEGTTETNAKERNSMRPDFDSTEWRHAIDHRNRWLPNVPIYDRLPDGWRVMEGAMTQPRGTCRIATGSLFSGTYRHALMWL